MKLAIPKEVEPEKARKLRKRLKRFVDVLGKENLDEWEVHQIAKRMHPNLEKKYPHWIKLPSYLLPSILIYGNLKNENKIAFNNTAKYFKGFMKRFLKNCLEGKTPRPNSDMRLWLALDNFWLTILPAAHKVTSNSSVSRFIRFFLTSLIDLTVIARFDEPFARQRELRRRLRDFYDLFPEHTLDAILHCQTLINPKYRQSVSACVPVFQHVKKYHLPDHKPVNNFLKLLLISKLMFIMSHPKNYLIEKLWSTFSQTLNVTSKFVTWSRAHTSWNINKKMTLEILVAELDSVEIYQILYPRKRAISNKNKDSCKKVVAKRKNIRAPKPRNIFEEKSLGAHKGVLEKQKENRRPSNSVSSYPDGYPSKPRNLFKESKLGSKTCASLKPKEKRQISSESDLCSCSPSSSSSSSPIASQQNSIQPLRKEAQIKRKQLSSHAVLTPRKKKWVDFASAHGWEITPVPVTAEKEQHPFAWSNKPLQLKKEENEYAALSEKPKRKLPPVTITKVTNPQKSRVLAEKNVGVNDIGSKKRKEINPLISVDTPYENGKRPKIEKPESPKYYTVSLIKIEKKEINGKKTEDHKFVNSNCLKESKDSSMECIDNTSASKVNKVKSNEASESKSKRKKSRAKRKKLVAGENKIDTNQSHKSASPSLVDPTNVSKEKLNNKNTGDMSKESVVDTSITVINTSKSTNRRKRLRAKRNKLINEEIKTVDSSLISKSKSEAEYSTVSAPLSQDQLIQEKEGLLTTNTNETGNVPSSVTNGSSAPKIRTPKGNVKSKINTDDSQKEVIKEISSAVHTPSQCEDDAGLEVELEKICSVSKPDEESDYDDIDEASGSDGDIVPCDENSMMFTEEETDLYKTKMRKERVREILSQEDASIEPPKKKDHEVDKPKPKKMDTKHKVEETIADKNKDFISALYDNTKKDSSSGETKIEEDLCTDVSGNVQSDSESNYGDDDSDDLTVIFETIRNDRLKIKKERPSDDYKQPKRQECVKEASSQSSGETSEDYVSKIFDLYKKEDSEDGITFLYEAVMPSTDTEMQSAKPLTGAEKKNVNPPADSEEITDAVDNHSSSRSVKKRKSLKNSSTKGVEESIPNKSNSGEEFKFSFINEDQGSGCLNTSTRSESEENVSITKDDTKAASANSNFMSPEESFSWKSCDPSSQNSLKDESSALFSLEESFSSSPGRVARKNKVSGKSGDNDEKEEYHTARSLSTRDDEFWAKNESSPLRTSCEEKFSVKESSLVRSNEKNGSLVGKIESLPSRTSNIKRSSVDKKESSPLQTKKEGGGSSTKKLRRREQNKKISSFTAEADDWKVETSAERDSSSLSPCKLSLKMEVDESAILSDASEGSDCLVIETGAEEEKVEHPTDKPSYKKVLNFDDSDGASLSKSGDSRQAEQLSEKQTLISTCEIDSREKSVDSDEEITTEPSTTTIDSNVVTTEDKDESVSGTSSSTKRQPLVSEVETAQNIGENKENVVNNKQEEVGDEIEVYSCSVSHTYFENGTHTSEGLMKGEEHNSSATVGDLVLKSPTRSFVTYMSPKKSAAVRKRSSLENSGSKVKEITNLTPLKVASAALSNEIVISPDVSDEENTPQSQKSKVDEENGIPYFRNEKILCESINLEEEQIIDDCDKVTDDIPSSPRLPSKSPVQKRTSRKSFEVPSSTKKSSTPRNLASSPSPGPSRKPSPRTPSSVKAQNESPSAAKKGTASTEKNPVSVSDSDEKNTSFKSDKSDGSSNRRSSRLGKRLSTSPKEPEAASNIKPEKTKLSSSSTTSEVDESEDRDKVPSPSKTRYLLRRLGHLSTPEKNALLESPRRRRSCIFVKDDEDTLLGSPVRPRTRRNSLATERSATPGPKSKQVSASEKVAGNLTPVRRSRRLSGMEKP